MVSKSTVGVTDFGGSRGLQTPENGRIKKAFRPGLYEPNITAAEVLSSEE
jgi:hypothetical protein